MAYLIRIGELRRWGRPHRSLSCLFNRARSVLYIYSRSLKPVCRLRRGQSVPRPTPARVSSASLMLCSRGHPLSRFLRTENNWRRRLHTSNDAPCARSWLGYQCTQLVCGRIRMHWSLGGEPPSGPGCSYSQNTTQVTSAQLVHIALQTDYTGYVALSWPDRSGHMAKADAVIGFLDDGEVPHIQAYKILSESAAGVQPDGSVSISNTGLEVNETALTICFTRNITQVGKGAQISIAVDQALGMNFAASTGKFGQIHSLHKDHLCSEYLALYRTLGGPDDGGWRPSNVSAAAADNVVTERLGYMRTHGALMFTGWIGLVPLGILAARHRWVFETVGVVGLWFQVHRAVQIVATTLVVAGFVLPWTSFDSHDEQELLGIDHSDRMESDVLLETHETLAILLMTVLGLHIVVALLRPKPDAPRRWVWNLVHWWTGRALPVLAGINVAIGIALWCRVSGGTGAEWLVPLVLLAVGWVALAIWLERRGPPGLGRDGGGGGGATKGPDPRLYVGFVPSSSPASSPTGVVALTPMPEARSSNGMTIVPLSDTYVSNGLVYNKL